jgi:dihydropteroate synthase
VDLDRPLLMGVLNVTPDSFSDGGRLTDVEDACRAARRLVAEGADIIDVGGESSRPGAAEVSTLEEIRRVVPVIEQLATEGFVVSVDTMKPDVAAAAIAAGAEIVNDITGFTNPNMRAVAAESGVGVVVMHMQGNPRTMQIDPLYGDVVSEVGAYLAGQAGLCRADGIDRGRIVVDPGIGFGKTVEHNLTLVDRLDELVAGEYPVMVGASRKSFLGRILDIADPADRDVATAITTAIAVERGAKVIRVHEPAVSLQAARLAWAIVSNRAPSPVQPS